MLRAYGVTHPGRVRPTNEDSLLADADLSLYLVADGMGGHNAGEVASRLAVEAIRGFMSLSREGDDFTWPYGLNPTLSFQANRLMTAVKLANRRVFKAGESRDEYTGLGTTVVAALVTGSLLTFAGVGDSRIYLLSDGRFDQITEDDSWVATVLGRQPGADKAALAEHPMRHVLTNVLGAREPLEMDVAERALSPGDRLLLCSDGLHGSLSDETMAATLRQHDGVEAAANALVEAALAAGAPDNVTALVVDMGRP